MGWAWSEPAGRMPDGRGLGAGNSDARNPFLPPSPFFPAGNAISSFFAALGGVVSSFFLLRRPTFYILNRTHIPQPHSAQHVVHSRRCSRRAVYVPPPAAVPQVHVHVGNDDDCHATIRAAACVLLMRHTRESVV